MTRARADSFAATYPNDIKPGNIILITDEGVAPGTYYTWDGTAWIEFEEGGGSAPTTIAPFTPAIFVSKTGNDTTGDGSISKPFLTIQKAHDNALTVVADGALATILVFPGVYSGAVSVSRPRTVIVGFGGSTGAGTTINGSVTYNPSTTLNGNEFNTILGLCDVMVNPSAGDAITMTGVNAGLLELRNVKIAMQNAGQRAILVNGTSVTASPMHWVNVDIKVASGSTAAVDLLNVSGYARNFVSECGASPAIIMRSGKIYLSNGGLEANNATGAVSVLGGTLVVEGMYVTNDSLNADVAVVANGGTFASLASTIYSNGSTGFAVKGVAGATFQYINTGFVGSTQISAAMTTLAAPSTPTAV
jgi:hypothetical protein